MKAALVLSVALLAAGCASPNVEDESSTESSEEAITDARARTLAAENRIIRVRALSGNVGWDMPVDEANKLTDEQVLQLNSTLESGRYDVTGKDLHRVWHQSKSCASDGEPASVCTSTDTIFEFQGRYYLRRQSFERWQPRGAQADWYLILDRASARWVVERLLPGEKRDGRDHIYRPVAEKFLRDPASIAPGTRPFLAKVETPAGVLVVVFENYLLFDNSGRVWQLDLDRHCPNGLRFDGNRCS